MVNPAGLYGGSRSRGITPIRATNTGLQGRRGLNGLPQPLKSPTALIRHRLLPQFEKAMTKKLVDKKNELNIMRHSLDELANVQRLANSVNFNPNAPSFKWPLTVEQLNAMPMPKLMEALTTPPLGDKGIQVPGHKPVPLKEFLQRGVPVGNIRQDHKNYFAIIKALVNPGETQDVSAQNGTIIKISFPKGSDNNDPARNNKEAFDALGKIHSETLWPEGEPGPFFTERLLDAANSLRAVLARIPRDQMKDVREKLTTVISRIDNTFNMRVVGEIIKPEDAVKVWLLDNRHDGIHVTLKDGRPHIILPNKADRGKGQKDLEQATTTVNLLREDGIADTRMLIHHQGEVFKMFFGVADLEKRPISRMAEHIKQ